MRFVLPTLFALSIGSVSFAQTQNATSKMDICTAVDANQFIEKMTVTNCIRYALIDVSDYRCHLDLPAKDPAVGPGEPRGDGIWSNCKALEAAGYIGERFRLFFDFGFSKPFFCSGQILTGGIVVEECHQQRHD
jgi:hypothetical protein